MKPLVKACSLLLLLMVVGLGWGCASTGSEKMSDRPWNAPMNWENGLPPSIMEGR